MPTSFTAAAASDSGPRWNAPRWVAVGLGVLVLVGTLCALYGPSLRAPLICDDAATVLGNPSIEKLWPVFDPSGAAAPLNPSPNLPTSARPLVNFSFALNYHFGQTDPAGYHAVNLALHLLTALLLWAVVDRTLRLDYFAGRFRSVTGPLSFAVAIVWAVHPLVTEAVAYVTQRTELMVGLFYLIALYACIGYWSATRTAGRVVWLALAIVACLLGMLSKETMATLPVIALLYERTFIAGSLRRSVRQSWPLYLGLAWCWLPLVAINLQVARTPLAGFDQGVPAYVWWFTQCKVLFLYLKLAVWPWPLAIRYGPPLLETVGVAWPWLLAAGTLIATTLVLLWRRRSLGFVAAWVLVVLSPTLLVPLVMQVLAERRMYLPLMALVALAVVDGYALVERIARKVAGATSRRWLWAATSLGAVGLVATCGLVTSRRLLAYQNELTLWQDAELHFPDDWLVNCNLGTELAKIDRSEAALVHFERAVALNPKSFQLHYNLARALDEAGHLEEAKEHYQETIRLRPDQTAAHYNLGRLLANIGQLDEAIEQYEAAVSLTPDFAPAHTNLGIALATAGNPAAAIAHFEAAAELKPDAEAQANLASAYGLAGRTAEAVAAAEKAIALARAQGDTAMAAHVEQWLQSYRNTSVRGE